MKKLNITPQTMLVVAPATAAVPSVLSMQVADEVGEAAHAEVALPHTHVPPMQILESVPEQSASPFGH